MPKNKYLSYREPMFASSHVCRRPCPRELIIFIFCIARGGAAKADDNKYKYKGIKIICWQRDSPLRLNIRGISHNLRIRVEDSFDPETGYC